MYDENMLIDLGGENYGEQIIRTVSEPDSYFPESLTLYDDIVSANIVATDDYGYRPDEYQYRHWDMLLSTHLITLRFQAEEQ